MIRAAMSERIPAWVRARPDRGAVGLLLAVSLAVRLRYLARPLHGDEMITFSNMVLGRGFGEIFLGPFDSNNHLLNSLIMKTVFVAAGENPTLMRLPNLVMTLVAVVLLYLIASREFGRAAGLVAALFFSLHPAVVLYSVSGRGYAGMVLFTLLSSALLLQALSSFSWRRVLLCAIAGFLAGGFHLFAVVALVAQTVLVPLAAACPEKPTAEPWSERAARAGRVILGPVAALALVVAVSLPLLRPGAVAGSRYFFQAAFPVALVNFLGGHLYRTGLDLVSLLLLALALFGFVALAGRRNLRLFVALLFIAPVALYALSYLAPVFTLHPRFFAFLLPFSCLLVAVGLQQTVEVVRTATRDRGPALAVARGIAVLCALLVAVTMVERIRVPRDPALIRVQAAVREFVDRHPDAHLLTNDPGFVRVRLRQADNLDRIRPALGIRAIRASLAQETTGAVYFIYVPQKRYTESDLIHYRGKVPPEELYRRDDRLRGFLDRNATLKLDLAPRVRIYRLREKIPQP